MLSIISAAKTLGQSLPRNKTFDTVAARIAPLRRRPLSAHCERPRLRIYFNAPVCMRGLEMQTSLASTSSRAALLAPAQLARHGIAARRGAPQQRLPGAGGL
jgi:hypothetical protein